MPEDHMIEYYTRKLRRGQHLETAVREYLASRAIILDPEALEDLTDQIKEIRSSYEYDSERLRERMEMQQKEASAVDAESLTISENQTIGETHGETETENR
jgi:DNA-binding ferritin-like protein